MNCGNCGKELKNNSKYCSHCGYKVEQDIMESRDKKEDTKVRTQKNHKIFIIIITALFVIGGIIVGIKIFKDTPNINEIKENKTEEESFSIGKTVEDLNEEIKMWEWEELEPTEEEKNTLSTAEWNAKYEYILYDNRGRELINIPGEKRIKNFYQYIQYEENSYYQYRLYFNALLSDMYHEEISIIYVDENFNVINQEIVSDTAITKTEYSTLLEEHNGYIEYIEKNKSYRNNLDEYRRIFEK